MISTGSAPETPKGSEEASHDDYRIRPWNPRPSTRRRARRRFVALAVLPTLIGALLAAGGHPARAQTADLIFTPTALSVDEGGTADYEVRLSSQPTADVTVTISGHEGTDVALNKTMLTFTMADYNTAQTVTVTAAQDEYGYDDTVTLTHSAADGGYDGVSRDYVVTVDDDEEPSGVITGIFPSNVLMNEAKVSLNIWEARPRTRLHWRYQAVGDSTWTTGASPKGTNLPGGEVTSEGFTFASRYTVALTGLDAGTTYEIQFALTGDNRTTNNEPPDFSVTSVTKRFSTTSQTIEISITDAASVADEGHDLLFYLARHHAGSYPPGLTLNYTLEVYNYIGGGPNKTDGLASTPESTTTGTTFFGPRDYTGGLSISTTRDNVCSAQWRARYYVVTLLDGDNYTPKSGRSGWEDGYTVDVEHRTQDCDWEEIGGL